MKAYITLSDLAKRWGTKSVELAEDTDNGLLNALTGYGAGGHKKYSLAYIEEIERLGGYKNFRKDGVYVKRLEERVRELMEENKKLNQAFEDILSRATLIRKGTK